MKITFSKTLLSSACIGASAILLSIGAAQAADPGSAKAPTFSQLDTNHDGYIDAKEASASPEVSSWASSADQDKDGKLSPKEFTAAMAVTGVEK